MTIAASPTDEAAPRGGGRVRARIAAIATHVPERVLTNEELAAVFPTWSAEKILEKTGIRERRIAAPGETASDLAEMVLRMLGVPPDDAREVTRRPLPNRT